MCTSHVVENFISHLHQLLCRDYNFRRTYIITLYPIKLEAHRILLEWSVTKKWVKFSGFVSWPSHDLLICLFHHRRRDAHESGRKGFIVRDNGPLRHSILATFIISMVRLWEAWSKSDIMTTWQPLNECIHISGWGTLMRLERAGS